jgi:arginyl-tRNA synthetase
MYDYLEQLFIAALAACDIDPRDLAFEVPRNPEHGDASTNVAMLKAKQLGKPPRVIAQRIIEALQPDPEMISSVEIAGAGFINIKYNGAYFSKRVKGILGEGDSYGRNNLGAGKGANVEYVSANPTGPLHPGHGRNIMLGDAISTLLDWSGYRVTREYYFNNGGNQMNNLARSIYARYRQVLGQEDFPFDEENGYKGAYILDIARLLVQEHGEALKEENPENLAVCKKKGEEWCFASIKRTLETLGVRHDVFFNENSLYEDGIIESTIKQLKSTGFAYERDGAVWISTSKMGLENDRVIVKSSGEPTYRLPDMAYHRIKCERGDDLVIDIFGADHISTVQEVIAGVRTLGADASKIKVVLHQMVSFLRDGQPYKLSKRNGEQITLDDLIEELGVDVVRFFFLMRSADTQLVFDMNLAKEQSDKNPVFYLQYAHARLCSLFENAAAQGVATGYTDAMCTVEHPTERELVKICDKLPIVIRRAAQSMEPHLIADYLREVAAAFHSFYHDCRILGEKEEIRSSRLQLAQMARTVLHNGLAVLGLSAPQKM